MHGFWSVERTWYDADGQSVGVTVVMAKGIVVGTSGDGSGKLAVWDALELPVAEAFRDLGDGRSFVEWDLELGFQVG
jgi:hypothetical protein